MSEPVWIDKDLGKVTPTDEQIQTAANTYLEQVITNPDSPPLDRSLTSSSSATPADITGNLKSAFDDTLIVETDTTIWEQGTIGIEDGTNDSSSTRIRFGVKRSPQNICRVEPADGYSMMVHCYDDQGAYLGGWNGTNYAKNRSTWYTTLNLFTLPATVDTIRICFRKTDNSDITITSYDKCVFYKFKDSKIEKSAEGISLLSDSIDERYLVTGQETGIANFEAGAINSSGNNTTDSTNRNQGLRYAGFVPVKDAEYIISEVTQGTATDFYNYVNFYNSSFVFISRSGGNKKASVVAEVPTNAAFFRISLAYITTSQLGPGNVTSYVYKYAKRNVVPSSPKTKWYVFGDSISAGYYSMTASMAQAAGITLDYISDVTTEQGETTGSKYDSTLEHNYWGYANKWYLKRELVGKAHPGQGYFRVSANNRNGVLEVKNEDVSDAGLITVAWGFNDWHYDKTRGNHDLIDSSVPYPTTDFDTDRITTVNQAIWYCLGMLIAKAPNAKIIVQTPMNGWAYGGDFASDWGIGYEMTHSGTLADIHDDIVYWANYYGLQVLEMTYGNSIVNRRNIKDTLIDGSHPSDAAHQQLGRHVASALYYG